MTAILIAVIVYFSLSLLISLLTIGVKSQQPDTAAQIGASFINVLISLGFITWSILLLAA